jgi:hypothetical protein
MIPCFKCRHESLKCVKYRYSQGRIFKWIRVNLCRDCLSEFKSPYKFKTFEQMIEQAKTTIRVRYSLVSRDEWKNLREVKRQLEHYDKKRCKVCDANLYSDKCYRCGYVSSREQQVINFLNDRMESKS